MAENKKIYLKDVRTKEIFNFADLQESEDFSENYMAPSNLIKIDAYYSDGGGYNGIVSRTAYGQEGNINVSELDYGLSNNEAEYISCLLACIECSNDDLVFTDSALVVNQITQGWKLKAKNLYFFNFFLKKIVERKDLTLKWIPREINIAGIEIDKIKSRKW